MNLYVGTSGYSYKEWKGKFYPAKLPAQQMLHFYGQSFRAVEINSTFNGLPKTSAMERWIKAVGGDFKFALKAPRQITHLRRLKDADDLVPHLLETTEVLSEHRGPMLFQLPPHVKKKMLRDCARFLRYLPRNVTRCSNFVIRRGSTKRFSDCCAITAQHFASRTPMKI